MSVREKDDPALYTKIQEQNLLRQYDLLSNCIEIGLKKGSRRLINTLYGRSITRRFPTFVNWEADSEKDQ